MICAYIYIYIKSMISYIIHHTSYYIISHISHVYFISHASLIIYHASCIMKHIIKVHCIKIYHFIMKKCHPLLSHPKDTFSNMSILSCSKILPPVKAQCLKHFKTLRKPFKKTSCFRSVLKSWHPHLQGWSALS